MRRLGREEIVTVSLDNSSENFSTKRFMEKCGVAGGHPVKDKLCVFSFHFPKTIIGEKNTLISKG